MTLRLSTADLARGFIGIYLGVQDQLWIETFQNKIGKLTKLSLIMHSLQMRKLGLGEKWTNLPKSQLVNK